MLSIKHIVMAIVSIGLSACSGSDGDKFVGKWVNKAEPEITLNIEKDSNGNTFTVTDRMIFMQKPAVSVHHATVEDGNLVIVKPIGKFYIKMEKNGDLLAPMGRNCPGCEYWARAK